MTIEEKAIQTMENHQKEAGIAFLGWVQFDVSEFRAVREALEKQMPKKANISIKGTTDYNTTAHCPACHKMLTGIKPRHCIECGQAIDWSGKNE